MGAERFRASSSSTTGEHPALAKFQPLVPDRHVLKRSRTAFATAERGSLNFRCLVGRIGNGQLLLGQRLVHPEVPTGFHQKFKRNFPLRQKLHPFSARTRQGEAERRDMGGLWALRIIDRSHSKELMGPNGEHAVVGLEQVNNAG